MTFEVKLHFIKISLFDLLKVLVFCRLAFPLFAVNIAPLSLLISDPPYISANMISLRATDIRCVKRRRFREQKGRSILRHRIPMALSL